jgi:DNA primase
MKEESAHLLLRALGVEDAVSNGNKVTSLCPLHNDSIPSFSIWLNEDSTSFFNCFGCDRSGSMIRLIHSYWMIHGEYPRTAAKILIADSNLVKEELFAHDWGAKFARFKAAAEENKPLPDNVVKHYPLILNRCKSFEGRRCREFLNGRGISDESIGALRVRFAADHQAVVFAHTNKYGHVFALRARSRKAKRIYSISKEVAERDTGLTLKEFPSKRDAGYWFGIHLIDWAKPVVLVEGELDNLRLHTLGKTNVIASGGVGVTKAQINELEAFAYVLGYDSDESGQKANARIDQMIGPSAIIVYRANWSLAQVCKDGKRRPCKDAGDLPDKEALDKVF